jgi:hypothetical protein
MGIMWVCSAVLCHLSICYLLAIFENLEGGREGGCVLLGTATPECFPVPATIILIFG